MMQPTGISLWPRWLFLRGLGLIYLIAFLSLWVQIEGLIGSKGLLPVRDRAEIRGRPDGEVPHQRG